jgi:hypothetical protein
MFDDQAISIDTLRPSPAPNNTHKKTQPKLGFFIKGNQLLDFAFFVHNVLASNWIVLFDFHLAWHITLVLVSRVEVTSTSA